MLATGRHSVRLLPEGVRSRGARVYRRAGLMPAVRGRARPRARRPRARLPSAAAAAAARLRQYRRRRPRLNRGL